MASSEEEEEKEEGEIMEHEVDFRVAKKKFFSNHLSWLLLPMRLTTMKTGRNYGNLW